MILSDSVDIRALVFQYRCVDFVEIGESLKVECAEYFTHFMCYGSGLITRVLLCTCLA